MTLPENRLTVSNQIYIIDLSISNGNNESAWPRARRMLPMTRSPHQNGCA